MGEARLTDDGLALRTRASTPGDAQTMEAASVTYAQQPASLFVPPPDFQKLDMPATGGAMPPGSVAPDGGRPAPGAVPTPR